METKNERLVKQLKALVKDLPIDVLGHIEAPALCCRAGTVAIVKIDRESNPDPNAEQTVAQVARHPPFRTSAMPLYLQPDVELTAGDGTLLLSRRSVPVVHVRGRRSDRARVARPHR